MDLILLRHPPPDVPIGICYGQSDMPADPARFDAAVAGMIARADLVLDGTQPHRVISSPLRRCADAARHIAAHYDVPLALDDRLKELHFGAWEMRAWNDIDRAEIDAWASDPEHCGAPGGENARELADRVLAWRDSLSGDETLVVVSHIGPIRLLTALSLGFPLLVCMNWQLLCGGLCRLRFEQGRAELIHWNH